jgi:hypothetical protein
MSDDVVPVLVPVPVDPRPVRRGWVYSGLVAVAILVTFVGLSVPGFAITLALGFAMVFAGPVYAAFYVPIAVRKWRREPDDTGAVSPERDLIVSFGTLNQKLTMILSLILVVNLIVYVTNYLADANSELGIPCGMIAVAVGIPIFILNLTWIHRPHGVPGESIAIRNRVGAWRLITVNRVLSLLIWCGYPLVSIIGLAATF